MQVLVRYGCAAIRASPKGPLLSTGNPPPPQHQCTAFQRAHSNHERSFEVPRTVKTRTPPIIPMGTRGVFKGTHPRRRLRHRFREPHPDPQQLLPPLRLQRPSLSSCCSFTRWPHPASTTCNKAQTPPTPDHPASATRPVALVRGCKRGRKAGSGTEEWTRVLVRYDDGPQDFFVGDASWTGYLLHGSHRLSGLAQLSDHNS